MPETTLKDFFDVVGDSSKKIFYKDYTIIDSARIERVDVHEPIISILWALHKLDGEAEYKKIREFLKEDMIIEFPIGKDDLEYLKNLEKIKLITLAGSEENPELKLNQNWEICNVLY